MAKLNRVSILIILAAVTFFSNQGSAFANHAGAIEISKNTYSIFLYIFITLGFGLLLVIARIIYISKQINGNRQDQKFIQDKQYQRKLLYIGMIMLIIGFLSVGGIYYFLMSEANHH